MNNNSNIILLLISIIIIILASVSYLEFKKIKIELDKHKEILSNYKEKIELLLNLNKNIIQEQSQQQFHQEQSQQQFHHEQSQQQFHQEESPHLEKDIVEEVYINNQEVHIPEEQSIEEVEIQEVHIPNIQEEQNIEEVEIQEEQNIEEVEIQEEQSIEEVEIQEEQNIEEVDKNTISINFDNLDDILVNISSDDDNEPIEEVLNNKDLFEKYKKVSVKDLRKILMEKELPLSGNKTTLVNRILNNL